LPSFEIDKPATLDWSKRRGENKPEQATPMKLYD
jgi:hypothetical protein